MIILYVESKHVFDLALLSTIIARLTPLAGSNISNYSARPKFQSLVYIISRSLEQAQYICS